MSGFFPVLNHWIHLILIIFWMGGLAFQILIIAPFVKSDAAPPEYLLTLLNRFQKYITPLLLILIVTGGVNLGIRRAGYENFPDGYLPAFAFKVLLVGLVISIHFFGFVRCKLNDIPNLDHRAELLSRLRYSKWTFSIGIIIIFIASMLRQWRF
ncbi:MAG: hypothetical protein AAB035_01355 [Nitrospirota bacterium]